MSVVTLANAKQFSCAADVTLLDAARAQGLVLEHSCRTGRCGACKAKVLTGNTQAIKEEEALSDEEKAANYIFTCCRAAIEDVELDIEDLGLLGAIPIQTLPCKIDSLIKLAPDVLQLFLRLPPKNNFVYLAGQYIDVIAKNGVRRSYSIANALPVNSVGENQNAPHKVELHVREVSDGAMSHYWFNEAKANDLLRLEGPLGTFCFHEKAQQNIIFLATGTGIAPIKSMLEYLDTSQTQTHSKNIYVYWGGRTPNDIYWQPIFANLNVHFHPILSQANEHWEGRRGYVQHALLADNIDISDSVVYACGSDKMIHAAKDLLMAYGLNPKNFFSDAFVSSK
ncbi:MAG: 2Fe-2S iron-sulfur cluster-binding protein [Pseudomonadota bacterium]